MEQDKCIEELGYSGSISQMYIDYGLVKWIPSLCVRAV